MRVETMIRDRRYFFCNYLNINTFRICVPGSQQHLTKILVRFCKTCQEHHLLGSNQIMIFAPWRLHKIWILNFFQTFSIIILVYIYLPFLDLTKRMKKVPSSTPKGDQRLLQVSPDRLEALDKWTRYTIPWPWLRFVRRCLANSCGFQWRDSHSDTSQCLAEFSATWSRSSTLRENNHLFRQIISREFADSRSQPFSQNLFVPPGSRYLSKTDEKLTVSPGENSSEISLAAFMQFPSL